MCFKELSLASTADTADDDRQDDMAYDTDEEWAPNPYQTEANEFMRAVAAKRSSVASLTTGPPVTIFSFLEPKAGDTGTGAGAGRGLRMDRRPSDSWKRRQQSLAAKLIAEGDHEGLEKCLMQLLQADDGSVSPQIFKKLIFACEVEGDMDRAETWWSWFIAHNVHPTSFHYKVMLSAHTRRNNVVSAEYYLELLMQAGSLPTVKMLSTFVDLCANVGAIAKAESWFTRMQAAGLKADQILYHSMLKGHANSGNVWACATWLAEMRRSGVEPVTITYNIMINACAKAGRATEAKRFYDEMIAARCTPDHFTFGSLIAAAAWDGDIEQAKSWFEALITAGLAPNEICVKAVIKAFMRGARSKEAALEWLDEIRARDCMQSMGLNKAELQTMLDHVMEDPGSPLNLTRRSSNRTPGWPKQPWVDRRRKDARRWSSF